MSPGSSVQPPGLNRDNIGDHLRCISDIICDYLFPMSFFDCLLIFLGGTNPEEA